MQFESKTKKEIFDTVIRLVCKQTVPYFEFIKSTNSFDVKAFHGVSREPFKNRFGEIGLWHIIFLY